MAIAMKRKAATRVRSWTVIRSCSSCRDSHRTTVDTSQLDEDHGEVGEDDPHAEAQTDQKPWMARAQYREKARRLLGRFLWDFLSRNAITIFDRLEGVKALPSPELAGELALGKPVPVVGSEREPSSW